MGEAVVLTGTVTLEGDVERGIVWLFCRAGGGCAVEFSEEEIIRALAGRFSAWKVRDGLFWLREQGVAVPVSRVRRGFIRRCWAMPSGAWSRLRLLESMCVTGEPDDGFAAMQGWHRMNPAGSTDAS